MAYIETNRSAALRAALGTKPAASGILAFVSRLKGAFETAQNRQKLRNLPPHILRDIGMTQGDISVLQAEDEILGRRQQHALRHSL